MTATRFRQWGTLLLVGYTLLCSAAAVVMVEATLHPQRLPLERRQQASFRRLTDNGAAEIREITISAQDGSVLHAWSIKPQTTNGDAVILLHGQGDNRLGMTGYGELLLRQGYRVLMPDARAHGLSGGELATYGLLERDDIRRWFEWLAALGPHGCIFGFGESMGAAQLLESLQAEPDFCAVAAESSFADFREIAYDRVGQFFRSGPWLGRAVFRPAVELAFFYARKRYGLDLQRVSPEAVVSASRVPVLLIHGQSDSNIPVRHARLIRLAQPATVVWEVPHTDHCGAISTAPAEFQARVLDWFASHRH